MVRANVVFKDTVPPTFDATVGAHPSSFGDLVQETIANKTTEMVEWGVQAVMAALWSYMLTLANYPRDRALEAMLWADGRLGGLASQLLFNPEPVLNAWIRTVEVGGDMQYIWLRFLVSWGLVLIAVVGLILSFRRVTRILRCKMKVA